MKNLNIPFPPRDWFWLHAVICILLFGVGLLWLSPGFGLSFLVNAVLLLPVFGPWLLSGRFHNAGTNSSATLAGISSYAAAFGYLHFCEKILSPHILSLLN